MSRFTGMLRLVHSSGEDLETRKVDDEASRWVVLLTSGESTETDHDAFRRWRDQSSEHAQALARARTLWKQMGAALPHVQSEERAQPVRFRSRSAWAMAASLLLCLGLGNQYLSTWQYDQVTVAGERRVVKLQDGSEMIMSGDTAIDVRFEAGSRRIDLARGQGLFRVAHDQRRPFVVYADGYSVRDIGTVFNVAHHADGVRVVVVEGAVEAASGEQRALLRAGQGLNIAPEGLGKVQPVDAALATAWSGGRLVVQNQSLAQILEALKPHYSGRIFLLNKEAGARRLSVVIDLKRVDDWLTGLSKTKAVQMKRIGNVVILT